MITTHWILSCASWIKFTYSHPISLRSSLISPDLRYSSQLWCHVVMWFYTSVSEDYAASIFTSLWRWRQHGPPKCLYPTSLHSVTTLQTATWVITGKTSSLSLVWCYTPTVCYQMIDKKLEERKLCLGTKQTAQYAVPKTVSTTICQESVTASKRSQETWVLLL